ncbi:ATP-binding protein [Halorubrum distributum]|uniref:histidine kinase n=1 Tax=Halorubrum distributum JCM 13916 TaxID=1230455 RepID=M0PK64_9EURY|nr:sensor histidine kinase [Halorubrum arcis]EMA70338.1 histidine kinase [Halorubrum arcis JCM 13916]
MTDSPENVSFTIDSRLLEELGENLVTRNHVAVGELVKNAYDADATEVHLEFVNASVDDTSESEIQIIDNGVGMSLEDVRNDFMRIATTDKLRNPITKKYGREKAGDKGIGRFAVRRLAHELRLETTAHLKDEGVYERTILDIPWRRYQTEQEIDEVTFRPTVERIPDDEDVSTGTTIGLRDLKDSWTQRDFNTLRRNIATLSIVQAEDRGDQFKPDPGFEIIFDAPEFEMGEGSLSEQVYDAGWGCLEGNIEDDGTVSLTLEAKLIDTRNYTFSHDTTGLGGTSFKIAYIPLSHKEHFRDPQTLNMKEARKMTQEQGGVRVYKGGFRVFSYGGPNDDWLNLDQRRTTHSRRNPDEQFEEVADSLDLHTDFNKVLLSGPNNRNLIGRVMISSDAELIMASNREDFQDDELLNDLREVLLLSLEWMTLQWSHYKSVKARKELEKETKRFQREQDNKKNKRKSESQEGLTQFTSDTDEKSESSSSKNDSSEPVDSALDLLEGVADTATETVPEEDRGVSDEAVETATKVIRSSLNQKEEEIDFFRSAFSVNQVVFSFSHELRSMVNSLGSSASRIEATIDELPAEHQDRFEEVVGDLRNMQDRFEDQMELFSIFMETGSRKEVDQQKVSVVVDDVVNATEYIAQYYDVTITTEVPSILRSPPMYKSELYSIVINLVTNSIKAVGASSGDKNQILVEGSQTDDGIRIRVYDSGVGLPEEAREDAFQPLVSDPVNNVYDELSGRMPENLSEQLGKGTGLGLSIVRNIAEKYGGTAQFTDADEWSTCVEVTINE